ncbi:hypothetical protein M408DRAFT_13406 [Serendipita vermifera MAFF 305830]|uniref:Uncharacterized protein n=1 Tax=Serendipita vermifera MAFF 305830 TaxID=933852 RepID=A0A0C3AJY0_SERVB|nr:hypothetical protein M408DRAFT_13406 [Serendipita vermifera MAFF 305830]
MADRVAEVNKGLLTILPPEPEKWLAWQWDVENTINISNVWRDIMTPDPATGAYPTMPVPVNPAAPTPAETAAIAAFTDKATLACQWIKRVAGRHNDEITRPRALAMDPVGMWQALDAEYAPKGVSERISTFVTLNKMVKTADEGWVPYMRRQDDQGIRFLSLFPTNMSAADVKDLICMINLIHQLPSDNPTRVMLEASPNLSLETVRNAIKQYSASHGGEELPTETASRAHASSSQSAPCHLCGYPHLLVNCHFFPYYKDLFFKDKNARTGYFGLSDTEQATYRNRAGRNQPRGSGSSRRARGGHRGRGGRANAAVQDTNIDAPPLREEFAGGASLSSTSADSANCWIADSGASISMTFRREWIFGMRAERRLIRLADGLALQRAQFSSSLRNSASMPQSTIARLFS